jgi:hypothetical protein
MSVNLLQGNRCDRSVDNRADFTGTVSQLGWVVVALEVCNEPMTLGSAPVDTGGVPPEAEVENRRLLASSVQAISLFDLPVEGQRQTHSEQLMPGCQKQHKLSTHATLKN